MRPPDVVIPADKRVDVVLRRGSHTIIFWFAGAQCTCGWDKSWPGIPAWLLKRFITRHWRSV